MMATLNTTICVSGSPVAGSKPSGMRSEGPLVVNGETIPIAAIAAEAQNHQAPRFRPGIAWRKAANALAVRTLLLQEARRRGIQPSPRQVGPGRRETEEEALIRSLLEAAVEVEAPTEEETRAEYDRAPARFHSPPLWEVSHVLIACDPEDETSREAARARAEALAVEAMSDPNGFPSLARRESDCGSRSSGGALGQIGPGDTVPEFEAVVRKLSLGEVTSGPVLSRHGWHLIRLDAVAEGRALPYEAVRSRISEALEKAAWTCAARRFVAGLAASADLAGADLQPVQAAG